MMIMAIPSVLICGGLYLGLTAIDGPGSLAWAGLLAMIPSRNPLVNLASGLLSMFAVLGLLVWIFS